MSREHPLGWCGSGLLGKDWGAAPAPPPPWKPQTCSRAPSVQSNPKRGPHLQAPTEEILPKTRNPSFGAAQGLVQSGGCREHTCLSGRGFAAEELVVEGAVGRVEARLQEHAAVGDGLQRGRALVREPKANEELQGTSTGLHSDPPHRETHHHSHSAACSCILTGFDKLGSKSSFSITHSLLCTAMELG